MSSLTRIGRLAWIDIQRMIRVSTDYSSSSGILGGAVFVIWLVGGSLGGAYLGRWMGRSLIDAGEEAGFFAFGIVDARGIIALLWFILVLIYLIRTIGQRGLLSQPNAVLPVVPTNQAYRGLVLAEYVYFLLWLVLPAFGFGVGIAIGTESLVPIIAMPAAIVFAGVSVVPVGCMLGIGIRHVATRYPVIVRHKVAIIVGAFVVYMAVFTTGVWERMMEYIYEPLQRSPLGWYGDLAFIGTSGMEAATANAALALVLSLLGGGIAILAGERVATMHWFSDPATTERAPVDVTTVEETPALERRLFAWMGAPQATLIVNAWRLAARTPFKLLYALYPFLVLTGVFAQVVQTGEVPQFLPYVVIVVLCWAAGVIFTLNPLGDQGPALPSTLISRISGRMFVRAHLVAGLVIAIPVGTVFVAVLAWLSPVGTNTTIGLIVATPIAMGISALVSIGIGMAFPRFDSTNITRSESVVLPSRWGFIIFTLYVVVGSISAGAVYDAGFRELLVALLTLLPVGVSVSADELRLGLAVLLVPLLLAPIVGYRSAIRRFDRYTIA